MLADRASASEAQRPSRDNERRQARLSSNLLDNLARDLLRGSFEPRKIGLCRREGELDLELDLAESFDGFDVVRGAKHEAANPTDEILGTFQRRTLRAIFRWSLDTPETPRAPALGEAAVSLFRRRTTGPPTSRAFAVHESELPFLEVPSHRGPSSLAWRKERLCGQAFFFGIE